jgi:hypothetical protein
MHVNSDRTTSAAVPWQVQAVLFVAAIELVVYSQTVSFYNDEGFHLLAAWLVGDGKVPYRDFFYQHPPLFPFLYGAWMRLAGETWRSAHLLSAILTAATIWLVTSYVVSRQSVARTTLGILAALMFCSNRQLVLLGTVGHPYALCMLLSVLAFRLIVRGIETDARRLTWLAGVAAGGGVLSSFLIGPILPVLALWVLLQKRSAHRWAQLASFVAGSALWLVPLAWFFGQAPRATVFDLLEYHTFYRGPEYRVPRFSALMDGLLTLVQWAFSWERLLVTLLALMGIWLLVWRRTGERAQRAELGLAAGIAVALALFTSTPHPTFPAYFVVITPFLCILACHGVQSLEYERWTIRARARSLLLLAALLGVSVLKPASNAVHRAFGSMSYWNSMERVAEAVNGVAPHDASVYVPEAVYFVAHRLPPRGLENRYAPALHLPSSLAASLNIVPQSQIDEWVRTGLFAAVWIEADELRKDPLALSGVYGRSIRFPFTLRTGFDPTGHGYVMAKSGQYP